MANKIFERERFILDQCVPVGCRSGALYKKSVSLTKLLDFIDFQEFNIFAAKVYPNSNVH